MFRCRSLCGLIIFIVVDIWGASQSDPAFVLSQGWGADAGKNLQRKKRRAIN